MKKSVHNKTGRTKPVSSKNKNKSNRKKRKRRYISPFILTALFSLLFFLAILFFVKLKEDTKESSSQSVISEDTSIETENKDDDNGKKYISYDRILVKKIYTADDFGIDTVSSSVDYNKNGIDDYTDILLGARADAEKIPFYQDTYWLGGYPPDNIGVCSDLVWRAFKNAGYCLKCMIDRDISQNIADYPRVEWIHDSDIDFRRVPNLKVFFEKYGIILTTDTDAIDQWQPGDIVVFGDYHIGIISDKRNRFGVPYLLHNSGQPHREEDALVRVDITGHYRFDASKVENSVLIPFS